MNTLRTRSLFKESSREGKPFIYHTVVIYYSVTRLTNNQLNRNLNDYFHCFVSFLHFYVLNTFESGLRHYPAYLTFVTTYPVNGTYSSDFAQRNSYFLRV